jgi:hypothetical protein
MVYTLEIKLTLRLKYREEVEFRVEENDRFSRTSTLHGDSIHGTPDNVDHRTATLDGIMFEISFAYIEHLSFTNKVNFSLFLGIYQVPDRAIICTWPMLPHSSSNETTTIDSW